MIKYKTYKYLIKPTNSQKEIIKKNLEACTLVFNKFVTENGLETYKLLKAKDILGKYKREEISLMNVDSSALFNLIINLQDRRYNTHPAKTKKYSVTSYTTSNLSGVYGIYIINSEYVQIPKLGSIKTVMHRQIPSNYSIQKASISIDNIGNYYVCIYCSYESNSKTYLDINNSIGLDYSSTHFYVDSNGERCDMPHFYQMQEDRINKLKNVLKKCQKGSNNYYKIKDKIGKIYLKTKNQRNDYLHKLSTKIANQYDIVSIEDINMIEMAQTLKLAKNTYDNAYGKFADLLKYKLENQGKVLIKIDRYYPSSKKCHICGFINTNLQIDNRKWICPQCGSVLDRDVNAAINIKERGIEEYRSLGYRDIKPIR